jgi:AraC-like DNA-binding protein
MTLTAPAAPRREVVDRSGALDRALTSLDWRVISSRRDTIPGGAMRDADAAGFAYVRSGRILARGSSGVEIEAGPGDILFFSRPLPRTLRAFTTASLIDVAVTPSDHRRDALEGLPDVMVVRRFDADEPAMVALVESMCDSRSRAAVARIGDAVICSRIVTTIASVAVRRWSESGCAPAHWLAGVADPQIGRALAAVHAELDRDWTVQDLARVATMSRSAFAARFREVVGRSPAGYLAAVRMDAALDLLRRTELTVGDVAARLGYGSEAGFSRAFRRHTGAPPGQWRHGADDRYARIA